MTDDNLDTDEYGTVDPNNRQALVLFTVIAIVAGTMFAAYLLRLA